MTIKAEQIYKEEWTKVDYLDFRDNLRGQGKRCGGMVKGAMFDRAVCRLIKRKIKWGNWDDENDKNFIATLEAFEIDICVTSFKSKNGAVWHNCRPVRKDEVTFYEDKKDVL